MPEPPVPEVAVAGPSALSQTWAVWWKVTKDLLFPQFCQTCSVRLLTEENGYFCPTCWERSPRVERPFCTACGRPHPGMVGFGAPNNFPCADCREKPNKHIRRIYGACTYDDAIGLAVRMLKFRGKERLAGPLAEVMANFASAEMLMEDYDVIVPVPLHAVRQRERGFNQSELLARALLGAYPHLRLDLSLRRIRPTISQARLSGNARQGNVRGAFAVVGEGLSGASVLLIDDVVTTAGTVTECARVLKLGGARCVDVFAAALAVDRVPDL